MKKVAIIEARMTSSRLPGKVLMESCGRPMLQHMIERLKRSKELDDVVVATTINADDDPIVALCGKLECHFYRGSEEDVLLRVLEAAEAYHADLIIETTGDCPLIDWRHIDYLVKKYQENEFDFVSNCTERTFPDGFDIRVFSTKALRKVSEMTSDPLDREHVAVFFPKHTELFKCYNWKAENEENRSDIEVTLDEIGDYKLLNAVLEGLYKNNPEFSCTDVIKYIDNHKELLNHVSGIKRKGIN